MLSVLERWTATLRARWIEALLAAGGLVFIVLVMLAEPVKRVDHPLPELPLDTLDGRALRRADFAGRPWIINVWLPG